MHDGTSTDGHLRVLVVDDEPLQRQAIRECIDDEYGVSDVGSADEAVEAAERDLYDLALVDLRLGDSSGLDLIPRLLGSAPWMKVVLLTAHASVQTAVQAMRLGATDYLTKPVDPQAVRVLVERLAAARRLERRVAELEGDIERAEPPPLTSSRNPAMLRLFELAKKVAASDAVVLLRGPSGTGKGVLAREIHRNSQRAKEVFSVVNCPSLSAELLQSELFGHVKGSFTGAVKTQAGKVEVAAGGTLFLDEIGDLPISIQPKLLRFIQERKYERVGDPRTREANVRIISATNRDLEEEVEEGTFREDLFYRLNVIQLDVPPLEDRPEDIEDLARSFLRFFTRKHNQKIEGFSDEAWSKIVSYSWPGNVRELQNAMERAVILCEGSTITSELLPISGAPKRAGNGAARLASLVEMERKHVQYVLENTETIAEAAEALGVAPSTLRRKRRKHDL